MSDYEVTLVNDNSKHIGFNCTDPVERLTEYSVCLYGDSPPYFR
jgi:hypothetical protein